MTIRIALIGIGKIARDQHLPAIAADPRYTLAAVVSRSEDPALGVSWFADHEALFGAMGDGIDAVAICTPPAVRGAIARAALAAGKAVLLEKPPAATLGEAEALAAAARAAGLALYAAWHAQHAAGVAPARDLLAGRTVTELDVEWREDVRKWHPGQDWVWTPRGFGVFDPGINALSILTAILPAPLLIEDCRLEIPANRAAPITARLGFAGPDGAALFDWRATDAECWTIRIMTQDGTAIVLSDGGARLTVDGVAQPVSGAGEYPSLYARFAELVETRSMVFDRAPLRLIADALLVADRVAVAPFEWGGPAA